MNANAKPDPGSEKRPRDVVRTVRGNERNMWDEPRGQKPERLDPPTYEP